MEATMLMRFDPFRHVDPFRELDRALTAAGGSAAPSMPMDAVRRDNEIELRFDLPGVDATSIDVEVDGDELRVSAEGGAPPSRGSVSSAPSAGSDGWDAACSSASTSTATAWPRPTSTACSS
ncbi:MAG: hypothetical protein R2690_18435 [Acidimicrobiales bacterium]